MTKAGSPEAYTNMERICSCFEKLNPAPTTTTTIYLMNRINTKTPNPVTTDSLDIVEMIMTFEEAFGIEIKDEDAEKIKTVQEAVNHMHPMRTK